MTICNVTNQPERQSFIEEKLCYVYGGITAELFILSFQTAIKHSIQTYTLKSCNMYMKI